MSRQIFQRDANNQAIITIAGSYGKPIDKVEARFVPVKQGQGTDTDWQVIKANPLGGLFRGAVTVKGGWYRLIIRGTLAGKVVDIDSVKANNSAAAISNRVGVGEVFIIAGQSNAGGTYRTGEEAGAADDRVNCADFSNVEPSTNPDGGPNSNGNRFFIGTDNITYSLVNFSQLSKDVMIGPRGLIPFYWANLGDVLTNRLNVPVMFFNVAWAGTSIQNWYDSANGIDATSDYSGLKYRNGTPYSNLKAISRYYTTNMGLRAILWLQGENDTRKKTLKDDYKKQLIGLIKKSREDFGKDIPWVIARTSYYSNYVPDLGKCIDSGVWPDVIEAQNDVLNDQAGLKNVFPGPETDDIEIPRKTGSVMQCVHFSKDYYPELAKRWNDKLAQPWFATSERILPDTIPTISQTCFSSDRLLLTLPAGYTNYEWSSTSTGLISTERTATVSSGEYIARVTNSNGRIVQIPRFTVKASAPPEMPTISINGETTFCDGTNITLSSSNASLYEWNTGDRVKDLAVDKAGEYKVRIVDANGCQSAFSLPVTTNVKPRPGQPTVSNVGATTFCEDSNVTLVSSSGEGYLWSTGETTRNISTNKSGSYFVQLKGTNGCLSKASNSVQTKVNTLPSAPIVKALGDTVICQGKSVDLNLEGVNNNTPTWLTLARQHTNSITISDNDTTSAIKNISIAAIVTDQNNCNSKASNQLLVSIKPLPKTPSIQKIGAYTIEAKSVTPGVNYEWKMDGNILPNPETQIRVIDPGNYSVSVKKIYKTLSYGDKVCVSAPISLPFALPEDKGLTIYPNPSGGLFTVESRYNLTGAKFTVYTISGTKVYESTPLDFNDRRQIDLRTLAEGNYILKIESNVLNISKIIVIGR
ncbi:sialate O-acetylesterase [Pseudarcicella hirudinis]|uniref:sialate O-acetylesterase n=1 Tax=Pseudarcicella hirudinis TaxID=1079859 RepID=UPI0015A4F77B|nr:sialate O-acetylesterase [Pseudarcicella hirudinis]